MKVRYTFPLDKIDANIEIYDITPSIIFTCSHNNKCIYDSSYKKSDSDIFFSFWDTIDKAANVELSLKRLIKLCGGSPSHSLYDKTVFESKSATHKSRYEATKSKPNTKESTHKKWVVKSSFWSGDIKTYNIDCGGYSGNVYYGSDHQYRSKQSRGSINSFASLSSAAENSCR